MAGPLPPPSVLDGPQASLFCGVGTTTNEVLNLNVSIFETNLLTNAVELTIKQIVELAFIFRIFVCLALEKEVLGNLSTAGMNLEWRNRNQNR